MNQKLSAEERQYLVCKHRKEKNGKTRDRIKAVLAFDEGYSYTEIARILLLDDETIRRHIKDYFSKKKVKPESGGSQGHLDKKQSQELIAHLKLETYEYVKDICKYVKQTYKKSYSISGMTKWLKCHGFRYKKSHGVPAKANKEKQEAFIEYYNELKQKSGTHEPIYFNDSTHPHHQTQLAYGWIFKGERKLIARTACQRHVNYMGALNLDGHKIVYDEVDKVNGSSINMFLKKLRQRHKNEIKIHIIWDNAGYHRSKEVKKMANELNIELHYLPPYSPNLNPIERLWKIMHEHVSYNKYYSSFKSFREALSHFFRNIGKKKTLLRSRLTDNFHIIDTPNFAI
jgi:transposase